ncbi:MAG TPA: ATP-binding cassette domain-containing protein [Candidatus Methylacidiphilales bacterium]
MSKIKGIHLQIRNLKKAFGEKKVLKGIDLEVAPGEFAVVVGRSGCGKSTLLRLIAGLDRATHGQITLDGSPVHGIDPRLRIVFQDARLLPWKRVSDNVTLGRRDPGHAREARTILEHVGLADRAQDWPSVLSGGQRQRVSLARALITRPDLLLFDEPLGALDALTRLEMQDLLERLWLEERFTALLITHDVEEAVALADRVVLIEDGEVTLNLTVDLPRPRDRDSAPFAAIKNEVLSRVMKKDFLPSHAVSRSEPSLARASLAYSSNYAAGRNGQGNTLEQKPSGNA